MNAKKIVSYTLLGIIAAMIAVVIVLSFVTKKLSPAMADVATTQEITSPSEITVSKYENSKEYMYRMQQTSVSQDENIKKDYELVIKRFNNLGYFTYMQQLFLGLGDFKNEIVYGQTTSISNLHKETDGYLVEFVYSNNQTLKDPNGKAYTYDGKTVTFTKMDIFVDNSNEVSTYKLYFKTYTSDDTSVYYTYNICANVNSLYEICSDFDKNDKLQGKLA